MLWLPALPGCCPNAIYKNLKIPCCLLYRVIDSEFVISVTSGTGFDCFSLEPSPFSMAFILLIVEREEANGAIGQS